jgi:hypothetical protein
LRYELLPQFALKQLVEVYTKGAHKYTIYESPDGELVKGSDVPLETILSGDFKIYSDGADNWRKGLDWTSMMGSVKRHIAAWEQGEDIDSDPSMKTYHLANAAWGLFSLLEYYKIYPQGDDRNHHYLRQLKIGLDIDEVLAGWVQHWTKYHGQEVPETWNFDRDIKSKFEALKDDKEFWLSIPVLTKPSEIHFEPHCYITSRSIPVEWTIEWLDKNGFPTMPVYSIGLNQSKVEVALKSGIDIYVDDRFENFVELNKAGVCTYLFDAPHNQRYNVGHKRIYKLSEL